MTQSFWQQHNQPIIGLSPMDGVTDHPYRFIQKKYGKPDLVYTEFTSVEGVCHGATRLLKDFLFDESQRPVIAQVYGTTPDFFRQTAVVLCELGFDGIDINMGCPAKNVAHSGAGAALIKTPSLAQQIIQAVYTGIEDWQNGMKPSDCGAITSEICQTVSKRQSLLPQQCQKPRPIPVSVKTRVGFDAPVVYDWISALLETEISAIALHGRTLKQHYSGEASWELIGQAAELTRKTSTLLLGNGDLESRSDALSKIKQYQTNGALLGRASFGNPFVFSLENELDIFQLSKLKAQIAVEHAELFERTYQDSSYYNFLPMRKHLGWYVSSIHDASQIRIELFKTTNSQEAAAVFARHGLL
ncbi:tRNA-dihydrouridine synthase [Candidatus Woesebacteria bacterium]|nr:tRNA-dihydrouridine synthase [Candidatus Woesebacteria bacterium]